MKRLAETWMPTQWGTFKMIAYANSNEEMPHLALTNGDLSKLEAPLVRIHSECMTGDVFGSVRCDCGEQLQEAMKAVSIQGGAVLYLRQEGRGIGLVNKLHAYNLQDQGFNTADANKELGFEVDSREFDIAINMLKDLGVNKIRLMTNNPEKLHAFDDAAIELAERVPLIIPARKENAFYLDTKRQVMGHLLNFPTTHTGS
ncbi:GTP cyclohydrolase II [Pontibacter sp. G13]|uniref:GTP cyclohydrolase II n=1 Tax=Pontibacter sp. G13 TaxID=3074898 RepID=UPI002889B5B0|nr:GTP cyclohydrolase II [Pontibacter sp. G13]WNJ16802.1 GTP cyclohydrolase II [Pontibacter sp. G13]